MVAATPAVDSVADLATRLRLMAGREHEVVQSDHREDCADRHEDASGDHALGKQRGNSQWIGERLDVGCTLLV